jgi:hypothetical protein
VGESYFLYQVPEVPERYVFAVSDLFCFRGPAPGNDYFFIIAWSESVFFQFIEYFLVVEFSV